MTTALVATVPTDVGNLSWQADHLALEADDGGTQWLVSIATKERRQLPRPSDTGYWDLEFEDGLGKLTFLKDADDGSSGDDPPCEWAQDYLEWAAYRLGEDVTVKHSRSGMQYDLRRYLCLHEPLMLVYRLQEIAMQPCCGSSTKGITSRALRFG